MTIAQQDTPEYWEWLANEAMSRAEWLMNNGAHEEAVQEYLT